MNKTQINYARDRIQVIADQHARKLHTDLPEPKDLTWDERVGEILNGKATLKVDKITSALGNDSCPLWLRELFKFYDFSNQSDYAAKVELRARTIRNLLKRIQEDADKYLDQIVLDGKSDAAMINTFRKHKYI